jgi:hypothetical protein
MHEYRLGWPSPAPDSPTTATPEPPSEPGSPDELDVADPTRLTTAEARSYVEPETHGLHPQTYCALTDHHFHHELVHESTADAQLPCGSEGTNSDGPSQASVLPYATAADGPSSIPSCFLPFSLGEAVSYNASPLLDVPFPLPESEQSMLIATYLKETGTWCETTDSAKHFTVSSIHEMMESRSFATAAMALASRQLDTLRSQQSQVTLELYQHSVQLLIHQDPSQADAAVLATCTLLCVYEMISSEVTEWRRHLKVGTPP